MLMARPSSLLQRTLGAGTPSPLQVRVTRTPSRTVIWEAEVPVSKIDGGTTKREDTVENLIKIRIFS